MHSKNIINDSSFKRNQNQIYLTSQGKKNEVLKNGQGAIFSEINRRACPFIRQMRVIWYNSEPSEVPRLL